MRWQTNFSSPTRWATSLRQPSASAGEHPPHRAREQLLVRRAGDPHDDIEDLGVGASNVDHVDIYFNAGHPGVEKPHAHVVLWHVPAADEARVAQ